MQGQDAESGRDRTVPGGPVAQDADDLVIVERYAVDLGCQQGIGGVRGVVRRCAVRGEVGLDVLGEEIRQRAADTGLARGQTQSNSPLVIVSWL